MKCVGCGHELTKYAHVEICKDCRYDNTITITFTDAKRKYKLTKEEIESADLFEYSFVSHGNTGTKYLVSEIEELADKLTKNLDITDKRRQAYLKQHDITQEVQKSKNNLSNVKKQTREIVIDLVKKYNVDIDKDIENKINDAINTYYSTRIDIGTDIFSIAMGIANEIDKRDKRKKELNALINTIDEKYRKLVYSYPEYIALLENNTDKAELNQRFEIVRQKVNKIKNKIELQNEREKIIDDLLMKKYNKKYIKVAKSHDLYCEYISEGNVDLNKCLDTIDNIIKVRIERDKRKYELDKSLKKNKMLVSKWKNDKNYTDYIEHNKGSIDNIINFFKNKLIMKERKIKLNEIIKQKCVYNFKNYAFYHNYVIDKITLEEAILQLDDQIMKNDTKKQMNSIRNIACNIFGEKYCEYITLYPEYQRYVGNNMSINDIRSSLVGNKYELDNYYKNIKNVFDTKRLMETEVLTKLPEKTCKYHFESIKKNLELKTLNQIFYQFITSPYTKIHLSYLNEYEKRYIQSICHKLMYKVKEQVPKKILVIKKTNCLGKKIGQKIIDQLKCKSIIVN